MTYCVVFEDFNCKIVIRLHLRMRKGFLPEGNDTSFEARGTTENEGLDNIVE